MESIGLIAEYNPFHNGHLYQLKKIREKYKDATIILILSGNFTERGDVSIIDKFKKTKIALLSGIDLVIELPFPFATESADYFSYGAITLLEQLHVDKLIFGSESNDLETLNLIATTELNNEDFDKLVKIYSKMGESYPKSVALAIKDLTNKEITTPNDLLGLSYLKTILKYHYKIIPETIKRTNNYHDLDINNHIASGTAIRNALKKNKSIEDLVPPTTLKYLNDLHFIDDYFPILKYKIVTEKDLTIYNTVDEGIDKLLKKEILNATSYDDFITRIKSKRYTYNKLTRMLLNILTNFTKERKKQFKDITYIRILGFNEPGKKYLNSIKKDLTIPIISKISRNKDPMLEYELETTKIYNILNNSNSLNEEEYHKIIKGEKIDD